MWDANSNDEWLSARRRPAEFEGLNNYFAAGLRCLRVKSTTTPSMAHESLCPSCGTAFRSPTGLLGHLNDSQQSCTLLGSGDIPEYPIPAAFYARNGEEVTGRYHESSGYIFGRGPTLLDKLKGDENEWCREHAPYYPFADAAEWELGKFLAKNLTKTAIDEFLKLKWVRMLHCTIAPNK